MMMFDAIVDFGLHWFSRSRLSVFAFHAVPVKHADLPPDLSFQRFVEMLDFVESHYRVLPLNEVVAGMKRGKLPPHTACLTFDDGYPSWLEGAVPELLRRGLPATFYVTTGQFDGLATWHERLATALQACKRSEVCLPELGVPRLFLRTKTERVAAYKLLEALLKYQVTGVREDMLLHLMERLVDQPVLLPTLTKEQLKRVAAAGFSIGAHTHSHPILSLCDDQAAMAEIAHVRASLSDLVGKSVDAFAYPNGRPGFDFTAKHIDMVKRAGYSHAVTTAWGAANASTSPFEIPRFTPWGPGATRTRLQVLRNLVRPVRTICDSTGVDKPAQVMLVENGAGFGGAVIAAQNLVLGMDVTDAAFHVVTNLKSGEFSGAPALRSYRVIPDRVIDTKAMARAVMARAWPGPMRRGLLFLIGRADDVCNRLPYFLRLWRYARRLKPSVIHGNNDPASNREAMLVARLLGVPYVQHVRGAIDYVSSAPELLLGASVFVPVSMWLAADLLHHGVPPNRVRQIYDAVDTHASDEFTTKHVPNLREQLGLPYGQALVALVGMLVPWKGQKLFLDAIAQMSKDLCVTWLIIGGTPDRGVPGFAEELRAQVESTGLSGSVFFLGRVAPMSSLYAQLDVVVSASTLPEPLGLIMLEAMSSRCLFVGPAHGAAPEIVQHGINGFLFEPGNVDALASCLREAIAQCNTPVGEQLMDNAAASARRFQPIACAEHTARVYRSVLSAR